MLIGPQDDRGVGDFLKSESRPELKPTLDQDNSQEKFQSRFREEMEGESLVMRKRKRMRSVRVLVMMLEMATPFTPSWREKLRLLRKITSRRIVETVLMMTATMILLSTPSSSKTI